MQAESAKGWLGSPACGLVGPYAFEFQRTAQRGTDGRYNQRRASHRVTSEWRGQVLYVEAAELPLRHIRLKGLELVDGVWDLLFYWGGVDTTIWAALDKHCHWNLLSPINATVCPREGTWMRLENLRWYWMNWYGELQRRGLANGRYFPPPMHADLTAKFEGEVQLRLSWGRGYAPHDMTLRVQRATDNPWLLQPYKASRLITWCDESQ